MTSIEPKGDQTPATLSLFKPEDSTLQLWAQANVYGSDSTAQQALSKTQPAAIDLGHSSSKTNGTGPDSLLSNASPEVRHILGDFSIDGGQQPDKATLAYTQSFLHELQHQAYTSPDAALVTVASKLADDPNLTKLVTDSQGFITKKSVESLRLADEGSLVHQEHSKRPEARVLTAQERADLDYVASHDRVLGAAGLVAGALAGASVAALAQIVTDKPDTKTGQFSEIGAKMIKALVAAGAGLQAPDGHVDAPAAPAAGADKIHVRTTDQPMVDPDHFNDVAKRVLAKIDTGHTGQVTKEQLAKALQDPSFKDDEAQALVAMYQNFDLLHNLSGHEHFYSTAGITPGDLDKYQTIEKDRAQLRSETTAMKQWAHGSLTKFTEKGSDSITSADVERALKDTKTSPDDRAMLELVKKHFGEMDSWYNMSGLNVKDFDALDDKAWHDTTGKLVSGVWGSCYSVANDAQKAGTDYDLYSSKNPLESITPEGVRQGAIGDCYYEAVAAALAKSNPAAIRDMIKDNHNGTYTVTFPGAKDEPITVKAPTEAELGLYNRGSKTGVWASVLEKAYGQYSENHAWTSSNTPQEGADGGGLSGPVIKLLTGEGSTSSTTSFTSQADIANQLEAAFSSHPPKAVVTGINKEFWHFITFRDQVPTSDQFYRDHVYTITGFKPDGKGGGTVVVRNPWGGSDGTPDGTMEIPLAEFMKNFSDVTIQK